MNPALKNLIYGISVFIIFTVLMVIIKLMTAAPDPTLLMGYISINELGIGVLVAFIVTFTHIQKKKLRGE